MSGWIKSILRKFFQILIELRFIVVLGSILGLLSLLIVTVPIRGWNEPDGTEITLEEAWKLGHAPKVLLSGIGSFVIGILIYLGKPWVRHLLFLTLIFGLILSMVTLEIRGAPAVVVYLFLVLFIFESWRYLYRRPKVMAFFSKQNQTAEQAMPPKSDRAGG